MGQYCFAHWRLSLSSSVGVCNTPWPACRRLQPRMPAITKFPPPV